VVALLPAGWADQQYSVGHEHVKNPPTSCTAAVQRNYNVSIRVLQEYVKTQHPGNLTTSDLYYDRFSQLGKPSVYHTPRRPRLRFYDVIFSLVIIRLSRSLTDTQSGLVTSRPWIWPFDLEMGSWSPVSWASVLPTFSFARPSILDLGWGMGETDRQTDDGHQCFMAQPTATGA